MDLVKQVTSVELSNTLKQAGVTTPSLFFRDWTGSKEDEIEMNEGGAFHNPDNVNCFTVAELGTLLLNIIKGKTLSKEDFTAVYMQDQKGEEGIICYEELRTSQRFRVIFFETDNEASARGKMYLWLLKEGYIKGE